MGVDPDGCDSALTYVFALLGKRWSGLLVGTLMNGPARFGELSQSIVGISEKVLAHRLNELAAAGIVERQVSGRRPVSIVYALTPRGEGLRPALTELRRWAEAQAEVGR